MSHHTVGTLGHRRLSIMDPAGGDQPIASPDWQRTVIANGEIYNHPDLQAELQHRYPYRTGSDTESALHLYDALGRDMARRLDGMFALAIADGTELFLARDPIGIKPLYLGRALPTHGNGDAPPTGDGTAAASHPARGLLFASELKALAGRATDVQAFPPGTWFHTRLGFHRYYDLPAAPPRPDAAEHQARRLREALERAVTKRLMSDVPLGAFLSGGLDSSIIAALARRHVTDLHTFSVGVAGSADLLAARRVAAHLGTRHHEVLLTPADVQAHLPEVLYALESWDPDSVRSAIPCYFVSRLAAEHVKVVLTGEGADELFAGYRYYHDIADEDTLHEELRRSVGAMHNINLQRVDRLTMAHGLEGRVPFLDTDVVAMAASIPAGLKLRPDADGGRIEKWILRKAVEDLLPAEIVWRTKSQFDEGSGAVDLLGDTLPRFLATDETPDYMRTHPAAHLRSHEECVYHKLLTQQFAGVGADASLLEANVVRWADRPL